MQELRENTNRILNLQHQMQAVMTMFANFASNHNGCTPMQTDDSSPQKQPESAGIIPGESKSTS